MARKKYLKDARKRARQARMRKAKHGEIMQKLQQGAFQNQQQTPYLLNQLNQLGQPGYTFQYGDNMTAEQAVAQSAQFDARMDQMRPQPQQTAMPQPQQPQQVPLPPMPAQNQAVPGLPGGMYSTDFTGQNPNDAIVAAGKQASGVADIEAATPKIDASQVTEAVTPKLAEAGTEVAASAAGDAAGAAAGGGVSAGAVGAAGQVVDMGGQAIQKGADDATGKNVAGTTLSGVGKGAAMGATIGSIVPGIGTAIGAGVGAVAGGIAGFVKGKKTQSDTVGERRMSNREQAEALINMRRNATTTVGRNMGANVGASTAGANSTLAARNASGYAKYGSFMKYYDGGMKDLPGGVQMPIGYGVDKFVGNKHDQSGMGSPSGIILEEGGKSKPGIEVEDGELQTKVKTTKGKKDYIVSDYIVNPATGNTLAEDMEREIKSAKSKKQADKIKQKYVKLNEELKEDGKPGIVKAQDGDFTGGALSDEEANVGKQAEVEGGMFGEATAEGFEAMKARNPWYDFTDFDPSNEEDVLDFQKEYNKRAPEDMQITEDGKYGTQTNSVKLTTTPAKVESKPVAPIETDRPEPTLKTAETEVPEMPEMEKPDREEMRDFKQSEKDPSIRMRNPGTMIQALGPAYALTQNFSPETVATPFEKERILGRVNLNQERARADAATQGANRAIQSAVAGPAAIAAQQANLARAQNQQANISDREARQNVQIANQETGINTGVAARNARNFAQTQQFNAQMKKKAADQNIQNRIAAINQLGKIGTQTVVDRNQQRADIFQGQASQIDGEFDRALANYYQGSRFGPPGSRINLNTQGGTTMSQQQIDALYAQQAAANEADETGQSRKGGYFGKKGKVRRKRRKKK